MIAKLNFMHCGYANTLHRLIFSNWLGKSFMVHLRKDRPAYESVFSLEEKYEKV